jgi:hypothetical protein
MTSRHTSAAGTDLCKEVGANYGMCLPQAHTRFKIHVCVCVYMPACVCTFVHLFMYVCLCVS